MGMYSITIIIELLSNNKCKIYCVFFRYIYFFYCSRYQAKNVLPKLSTAQKSGGYIEPQIDITVMI